MSEFSPFGAEMRDMELATTRSRINDGGASVPRRKHLCPQCGQLRGLFAGIESGVKIRAVISSLRSQSPKAYCHKEKTEVNPRKGANMSKKEKFPLYLSPEKKAILERRYQEDGSRSITAFIERAVEQDMVAGILADAYQFGGEDLRRRRAESVQNVRKTNGRISLEQRVRDAWEEDDEWQD